MKECTKKSLISVVNTSKLAFKLQLCNCLLHLTKRFISYMALLKERFPKTMLQVLSLLTIKRLSHYVDLIFLSCILVLYQYIRAYKKFMSNSGNLNEVFKYLFTLFYDL